MFVTKHLTAKLALPIPVPPVRTNATTDHVKMSAGVIEQVSLQQPGVERAHLITLVVVIQPLMLIVTGGIIVLPQGLVVYLVVPGN